MSAYLCYVRFLWTFFNVSFNECYTFICYIVNGTDIFIVYLKMLNDQQQPDE